MPQWLDTYYADIDHHRLDALATQCADDILVHMGPNPPVRGRDAAIEARRQFASTFKSLSHAFVNVFEYGDTAVLEAVVTYTRHDGSTVDVPSCSLLHRTGELVDSLRVYLDLAPLWAPATETKA